MWALDHSATTGVVTVLVILIAVAALGALVCGCWCYLRLQRSPCPPEDQESMVAESDYGPPDATKGVGGHEPFIRAQQIPGEKALCVERQGILASEDTGGGG
ncbi:stannin-like [Petromyzon marinus]|uniref:stannin-like n=1 Tax=Petromyzon marinus TaxID=7757 RepID=UPI003F726B66